MKQKTGRAIVIGASMGGLLAARALADHFEQVTLLERDAFPEAGANRKGVPQGRHIHVLLARGREALEALFPGLTQEIAARGALYGDMTERSRYFFHHGYLRKYVSGQQWLMATRPLIEAQVRARVLALPNVQAASGCDVLGLAASEDRQRVTGVRVIRRAPGSAEEVLDADLVVDAGGRGSRSPAWLEALGYARPAEDFVRINLAYTSRLYRRRAEHLGGDVGAFAAADPPGRRGGAMMAMEGDRWLVSLVGYLGDHAPTDEAGFLAFARSLPAPDIYEVIRNAEPLSDPVKHTFPGSQRRRYERLSRFPQGYLVFGDALCSFNPTYGQGMTVGALEALALQECLARGTGELARRFFRQAARVIDIPWGIVVGEDVRYPEVEGPRSWLDGVLAWYMGKLFVAGRRDPAVSLAFLKTINLLAPPLSVLAPRTALRVLWGNLRPGAAAAQSAALSEGRAASRAGSLGGM